MKRFIILFAFMFAVTAHASLAALSDNTTHAWHFDTNNTDFVTGRTGTDTAVTYQTNKAKLTGAAQFGTTGEINFGKYGPFAYNNQSYSYNFWWFYNYTGCSGPFTDGDAYNGATYVNSISINCAAAGRLQVARKNSSSITATVLLDGALSVGNWYMFTVRYNETNGNLSLWINNIFRNSTTANGTIANSTTNTCFGALECSATPGGYIQNSYLDEFNIWNRAINDAEITQLYNSGNGVAYPFAGATQSTYTVNVIDLYDNTNLQGANVTFYNATDTLFSALTDANGNVLYTVNGTAQSSLSWNVSKSSYFNLYGTILANTTVSANASRGYVNITSITALVTGNTLSPALGTWSVNNSNGRIYAGNTTNYPSMIYLVNGVNNLTLLYTGSGTYYNLSFTVNITAPQNVTVNISGVYNTIVNVTAKNAYTNVSISIFSGWASYGGYNITYNTTNGTATLPLTSGLNYTVFIDAPGYALNNSLNYKNIVPTTVTDTVNFTLYTNNSILIYIYDQSNGAPIYLNTTIEVSGALYDQIFYTTNGYYLVENLSDGAYTVKVTAANYSLATYTVTVATRSTQKLNAYLTSSISTVILTIFDSRTGQPIIGASIGMYRLVNNTLQLVQSGLSDITGRMQLTYTALTKYTFTISMASYTTKTFTLDPVLFSAYDIYLTPTQSQTSSAGDITVYFQPYNYYTTQQNNFSILFNSPSGFLSNFSVNISWPGGSFANNSVNANGGSFQKNFNITGATLTDSVNLTYSWYDVFGAYHVYNYQYGIIGAYSNQTILAIKDQTYGMKTGERILVATVIAIAAAGVVTMAAGTLVGVTLGLFIYAFLAYVGFISWIMIFISLLVGFFIIARRSGENNG